MEIQLIPEAQKEYEKLDGSLRKIVDEKFEDLEENPYLGESLGNKNNIDLTGYYKVYFNRKKIKTAMKYCKKLPKPL